MSELITLWRQRLHRDRLQLIFWVVGTALLAYSAVAATADTYGNESDRREILGVAIASRTILVFRGTPNGVDEGAFAFFLIWAWLALMGGLMSTFLAVRHTRVEEEQGRAELVASTPAARILPTVATLAHGVIANVLLGLAVALAFIGTGLDTIGSFVSGIAIAVTGIAFLAIGLLMAQLFRTSRGANGAAVATVIGAYLLRGIGDAAGTPSADLLHITPAWPSWLSPIGYGQFTAAFVDNDLRPLAVPLGFAFVLIAIVFVLQSVRDQGSSLLPGRTGPATARAVLSSSFGLSWRLNTPTLLSWGAGAALIGLLATSLSGLVDQLTSTADVPEVIDRLQQALGGNASLEQAFVATFFGIAGVLAACCAVQVGLRARQEETYGTAETVLTTPVNRVRWLSDYWIVGVIVVVAVLAVAGLAGILGSSASENPGELRELTLEAAAAQLPVCLFFLGLTLLAFAWLPRVTIPLAWAFVAVTAIVGVFGPLLQAPAWLINLSPFTHSPVPAGDATDWAGGFWLLGIALVAAALAIASMRHRELAPGA